MVTAYNMTSPLPSQNVVVAPASTMSAYTYGPQQAAQYCPNAIPARNGCWNEALCGNPHPKRYDGKSTIL